MDKRDDKEYKRLEEPEETPTTDTERFPYGRKTKAGKEVKAILYVLALKLNRDFYGIFIFKNDCSVNNYYLFINFIEHVGLVCYIFLADCNRVSIYFQVKFRANF